MSDWNQLLPSSHVDTFTRDKMPPSSQWPLFIADRPELAYPDTLNAAQALVDANVEAGRADRTALIGATDASHQFFYVWTYAKLLDQVNRIAQVLTEDMGLVSGNRVLLRGANSPMMAACLLGVIKAGMVAVPTMPLLRAAELSTIAEKAQAKVALCDSLLSEELQLCMNAAQNDGSRCQMLAFRSDQADGLEARMRTKSAIFEAYPTSRDDVCLIAFTSGTPIASLRFVQARCSGATPYALARSALAPAAKSWFAMSRSSWCAAHCNAVVPSASKALTSTDCSIMFDTDLPSPFRAASIRRKSSLAGKGLDASISSAVSPALSRPVL